MARPLGNDFYQNFRFHILMDDDSGDDNRLPEAGFSQCTTPELSIDTAEYREGQFLYTRKIAGIPSMADITVSKGIVRREARFWIWIKACAEGNGNYRNNFSIRHYHREGNLVGGSSGITQNSYGHLRTYGVKQAYPTRYKVASDLDATSSDISVEELDFTYEHFDVTSNEPILLDADLGLKL